MNNYVTDIFNKSNNAFYRIAVFVFQFIYFVFPITVLTLFDLPIAADIVLFVVLSLFIFLLSAYPVVDWIIWIAGLITCFFYIDYVYSYVYFVMFGIKIILFIFILVKAKSNRYDKRTSSRSRKKTKNEIYEIKRKSFCYYVIGSVKEIEQAGDMEYSPFLLRGNEYLIPETIKMVSEAFEVIYYDQPYQQKGCFCTYFGQKLNKFNAVLHDIFEFLIYGQYSKKNKALDWNEETLDYFKIKLLSISNIFNLDYDSETAEMFDTLVESYEQLEENIEPDEEDDNNIPSVVYEIKRKAFCSMVFISVFEINMIGQFGVLSFETDIEEANKAIETASNAFDILFFDHPYQKKGNLSVRDDDLETASRYSSAVNNALKIMRKFDHVIEDLFEFLLFGYYDSKNRALKWDEPTKNCFQTFVEEVKRNFNLEYNKENEEKFTHLVEAYDKIKSCSLYKEENEQENEEETENG